MARAPRLKDADLDLRMKDKSEYQTRLHAAQLRLLLIQRQLYQTGRTSVIVFEGWDAAGKGGSIRRLVESLDPRGYAVHPIGAPTPDEKARNYFWRFFTLMPKPGSFGIFDRSWYGRVLVERVEGFASEQDWRRAYDEINSIEKMFVEDGVPVIKFFLHISKEEQLRRFHEREKDPFKNWKIGPDDWRNREKWDDYEHAIDDMFKRTSTEYAPWTLIPAEHKWTARVEVAEACVEQIAAFHGIDTTLPDGWRKLAD